MTGKKQRWEVWRQVLGWCCLGLAILALLFPAVTAPRPEPPPTVQFAYSHATSTPAPTPVSPEGRVDVNTADAQTLTSLPGIGPALAERILKLREERGRFFFPEELLSVQGIGEATLEKLRPLIYLGPNP